MSAEALMIQTPVTPTPTFPLEIWERIAYFMDPQTLMKFIKAQDADLITYLINYIFVERISKLLSSSFPEIDLTHDTRVSVKRLMQTPEFVETFQTNDTVEPLVDYIKESVTNTLAVWSNSSVQIMGASGRPTFQSTLDLIQNAKIDLLGHIYYNQTLLHAFVSSYCLRSGYNSEAQLDELVDISNILIDKGLEVDARNEFDETILHYIAKYVNSTSNSDASRLVDFFVQQHAADVDASVRIVYEPSFLEEWNPYKTPLHAACSNGLGQHNVMPTIKKLLSNGANPLISDKKGMNALDIVRSKIKCPAHHEYVKAIIADMQHAGAAHEFLGSLVEEVVAEYIVEIIGSESS